MVWGCQYEAREGDGGASTRVAKLAWRCRIESIDFEPRYRYVVAVAVQGLVLGQRPVSGSAGRSCRELVGVSGVGSRVVVVRVRR